MTASEQPKCVPPEGTESRTSHWIETPNGNQRIAQWYDEYGDRIWYIANAPNGLAASVAHARGYRYLAPVDPPHTGQHVAALVEALKARRDDLEFIRMVLVNNLEEPERRAFWRAVEGRNNAIAALAKVQP